MSTMEQGSGPEVASAGGRAPQATAAERSARILIVEDDPAIVRLERGLLEARGHEVLVCENGLDALPILYQEPLDLVLLDIDLPLLTGTELCRLIRKRNRELRDLPVIIVTASDGETAWRESMVAGADGFITKPFGIDELGSMVERWLRPIEARESARLPVQLRVVYRDVDAFLQEYTLNISRGGTFIRTSHTLEVGTEFFFHIEVPGVGDALTLLGEVTWVKRYQGDGDGDASFGMGVRFKHYSDEQRRRLDEVVARFARRTRILVVDDDELILDMTKDALEAHGYSVFAVNNLIDLFFFAERIKPDLVLLDMEMGTVRGDEVCKDLRQRGAFSGVPILLHSSLAPEILRDAAAGCGADGFIHKNRDFQAVALRVRELIEANAGIAEGAPGPRA